MPTIDNLTPGTLDQTTDLIVGWDAATSKAVKITKSQLSSDLSGTLVQYVATIAALRLEAVTAGKAIQPLGYYTPGDGGGGPLRVGKTGAAPGTYVDNGGSIIVPTGGDGSGAWVWEWNGDIDIAWFGAKGSTDSTAAIIAAASTGKPLTAPYGDFIVSSPVTIAQRLQGAGADDGQTTFTLTATGQFIIGDWFTKMDGFLMRSAVNDKVFIKCPMSYFTATNFRMMKVGAATNQCGIEFDTSAASVYFCNVDHFNISLPYPIRISGNSKQVFNANKIGGLASGYYQSFQSAISVDGVLACDGNEFCGYFETGTNLFSLSAGALRQNRFRLVQDNVTNTFNGIAVTDPNIWEILDGGFKGAGVYPLNQVFIGPVSTKVRATDTSAQSIPNAAATVLTFDTETFDTLSEFSNGTGKFTAKNTGYYRINASAISAAVAWAVGNRWQILIFKNDTEYATGERNEVEAAYTGQRSSSVSALVYLAAGDTLTARLIHNKGAAVSLDSSPTGNYLEIGAA